MAKAPLTAILATGIALAVLAAQHHQLEWCIPQTFGGRAVTLAVVVWRHPWVLLSLFRGDAVLGREEDPPVMTYVEKDDAYVLHLQAESSRVTSQSPRSVMHAGLRVVAATDKRDVLRALAQEHSEIRNRFGIFGEMSSPAASRFTKAVFLSHVRVLEMIAQRRAGTRVDGAGRVDASGAEWAAVFEDGAVFESPLITSDGVSGGLPFLLPRASARGTSGGLAGVDIVMVGKKEEQIFLALGPPGRRRVLSGFGTLGYVVNTSAVGKVRDEYNPNRQGENETHRDLMITRTRPPLRSSHPGRV